MGIFLSAEPITLSRWQVMHKIRRLDTNSPGDDEYSIVEGQMPSSDSMDTSKGFQTTPRQRQNPARDRMHHTDEERWEELKEMKSGVANEVPGGRQEAEAHGLCDETCSEYEEIHARVPQFDQLGAFARLMTQYPLIIAVTIAVLVISFVMVTGLPQLQRGFEGYESRKTYEAKAADGVLLTVMLAKMQAKDTGEHVQGQNFAPLSQEHTAFTIPFFFQSLSGDVLSEENIKAQEQVLSRAGQIVKDVCYQGKYAPSCAPASSLMNELGTQDSAAVKAQLMEAGRDHEPFISFLGKTPAAP